MYCGAEAATFLVGRKSACRSCFYDGAGAVEQQARRQTFWLGVGATAVGTALLAAAAMMARILPGWDSGLLFIPGVVALVAGARSTYVAVERDQEL